MTVAFLAEEVDVYCQACAGRDSESGGIVSDIGRVSVWVKIQQSALKNIVMLVRELGLTPSSRLKAPEEKPMNEALKRFLAFPSTNKTTEDS